jgi:hypothetical protein
MRYGMSYACVADMFWYRTLLRRISYRAAEELFLKAKSYFALFLSRWILFNHTIFFYLFIIYLCIKY